MTQARPLTGSTVDPGAKDVPAVMADRILAGAAEVLARLPLSKVTMEDVARATGIARQTIYKHFSNRDEIVIALFIQEIERTHQPRLKELHQDRCHPDQLVEMFLEQLRLANQWVLLSRTFDPALAPRIAELVLSSEAMAECNAALWLPILADYQQAGIVRADVDLDRVVRWTTYQSVWLLSHPEALTADPDERRMYVRTFIFDAFVSDGHR